MKKCRTLRLLDMALSFIVLFFLSPLFLVISLILRFTGEKEIFFKQSRIGFNGNSFFIIKFATMLKQSSEMENGDITVLNDPRVLPIGKFLRKTKINELPQIFNVLMGDMSFIGPRPLTPKTFNSYSKEIQKEIIQVRPGLSGIGSIIFRNEEIMLRSDADPAKYYQDVIAPYKGQLEIWFVQNISINLYFSLILATIFVVLFPRSRCQRLLFKSMPIAPKELHKYL